MSLVRQLLLLISVVLSVLPTSAQHQRISYQQAFGSEPANLYQPLPEVKWMSDHELMVGRRKENGMPEAQFLLDVNTKATKPYNHYDGIGLTGVVSDKVPSGHNDYTASHRGTLAAYTYQNNLYIIDTNADEITQITNDGSGNILNGYAPWLYYEEIFGRNHRAFWWSNDDRYLVFMRFDESRVPTVPIYDVTGRYGDMKMQRYPTAGQSNPKVRIGIVDVETNKLVWTDFNENDDQYFRVPYFTPKNQIWIQWVSRWQDTLKIFQVDPQTGKKQIVYTEVQPTWVTQNDGVYFLPGCDSFINRSDKSGWSHYYLHDPAGKELNQITSGEFNVGYIVKFDEKTNTIFFTARKENSTRVDLYRIGLDGKNLSRITLGAYSYSEFLISPGNQFFTATYSNVKTPAAVAVFDMNGNKVLEVASQKGSAFDQFHLPSQEIRRVKSSDGKYDLPLIITYPVNFSPKKRYPVVMNVYGGPYAMSVNDVWSLSASDIWWAQEGIIQVRADNRASGHFGRNAISEIYGKMGILETEDFMAIGKWLKQQSWVDTSKLCIMGYSHGGYHAAMALTYGANVFNYGIAFWPATDWRLVDSYFVERYMGDPLNNGRRYDTTAAAYYVDRYRGLLRLVHGTVDDNAHLRQTLQLADALQNANKHFEMMIYPGQGHGFRGEKWKHHKMETYYFFYRHLLNRELPGEFR